MLIPMCLNDHTQSSKPLLSSPQIWTGILLLKPSLQKDDQFATLKKAAIAINHQLSAEATEAEDISRVCEWISFKFGRRANSTKH